jgi:hypothetical protein
MCHSQLAHLLWRWLRLRRNRAETLLEIWLRVYFTSPAMPTRRRGKRWFAVTQVMRFQLPSIGHPDRLAARSAIGDPPDMEIHNAGNYRPAKKSLVCLRDLINRLYGHQNNNPPLRGESSVSRIGAYAIKCALCEHLAASWLPNEYQKHS